MNIQLCADSSAAGSNTCNGDEGSGSNWWSIRLMTRLVCPPLLLLLLCRPPLGIKPSSLTAYLTDNHGRALSIFSGILAGVGDLFQFMGGQTAGYAAAMMVMAYPVVGVLWGLFRFKELRHRPKGTTGFRGLPWGLMLVVSQVVMYVLSVGLLSGSAELRGH